MTKNEYAALSEKTKSYRLQNGIPSEIVEKERWTVVLVESCTKIGGIKKFRRSPSGATETTKLVVNIYFSMPNYGLFLAIPERMQEKARILFENGKKFNSKEELVIALKGSESE